MEAAVWTLIAMFGATVFGQLALINGLRKEIGKATHLGRVDMRLDQMEGRLDGVDGWRHEVDAWRRELRDRVAALER